MKSDGFINDFLKAECEYYLLLRKSRLSYSESKHLKKLNKELKQAKKIINEKDIVMNGLKLIRTRYGGKCSRCQREIGKEWDVYFSPETKAMYCKPCGEVLSNESNNQSTPDDLELKELIGTIGLSLNKKIDNIVPSILSEIYGKLQSIVDNIVFLSEEVKLLKDELRIERTKNTKSKTTKSKE